MDDSPHVQQHGWGDRVVLQLHSGGQQTNRATVTAIAMAHGTAKTRKSAFNIIRPFCANVAATAEDEVTEVARDYGLCSIECAQFIVVREYRDDATMQC